jgi:hypothetical protein
VDVERFYNPGRLRPTYKSFQGLPVFLMASGG